MDTSSLIDSLFRQMELTFDLATALRCSFAELGGHSDATEESAKELSEEILQSCKTAISLIDSWKSSDCNSAQIKRKRFIDFAGGDALPAHVGHIREQVDAKTSGSCARMEVTAVPFGDGHQWRKYGEKSIKGTSFKRSYYKCTYSGDQCCQAKKKVQQQDSSSYLVIHEGQHTCINGNSTSRHGDVTPMVPLASLRGLSLLPCVAAAATAITGTWFAPTFDVSGGRDEVNTAKRDLLPGACRPKRESSRSRWTKSDLESLREVPLTQSREMKPLQPSSFESSDMICNGSVALADVFSPLGFLDVDELLSFEF